MSEMQTDYLEQPTQDIRRFFGKYRGIVTNNQDPLRLGRIQATVPEVLGAMPTGWASPCTPYSGTLAGFFAVPLTGAGVWIEFEAGDPSRPVWVGGYWTAGKVPLAPQQATPQTTTKLLRSDLGLILALDDMAQTVTISDSLGTSQVVVSIATGTVTLKGAARVVVDAPLIQDGGTAAAHPAVLGDQLISFLTTLVTTFNMHMHPGQANAGGPVSPAPPQPPLSPPTPNLLSQTVMLK
jgi:type VI secretion system (T6SS) baseplate-like injector VgrG